MRLTTLLLRSRSYEAWNILIQKVGTNSRTAERKKLDVEVGAPPKKFYWVKMMTAAQENLEAWGGQLW